MGNNNTNDSEYSLSAVPESERKSYFSLTIVWTGFVFVITSMMAGGGLSAGLDFKMILLAIILGNVFLSVIAIMVSIIASKTGLTYALMTLYSFGERLPDSFYVCPYCKYWMVYHSGRNLWAFYCTGVQFRRHRRTVLYGYQCNCNGNFCNERD